MTRRFTTCNDCAGRITFIRSPYTGDWRPFDPKPIDRATHQGAVPYPVENERAWKSRELIEDLMVRRRLSRDEAEREVNDMPWHVPHRCPPLTTTEQVDL